MSYLQGNSAIYGSSRTLAALAEQSQAPRILAYIDRSGRPLVAILISSSLGLLCFLSATSAEVDVFNWLISLSGLSSIFTWSSVMIAHIRFRAAWRLQGHTLDELAWKSPVGIIGSYIGLTMNILILIAQFWTGFSPIGYENDSTTYLIGNFFQAYLCAPVVLVFFIFYKVWKRSNYVKLRDVDLYTGKRELNVKALVAMEKEERRSWAKWKRIYKFLC